MILTLANQAGSAGKTTSAVSLAALLAEAGHSVLLVDSDAQANASTWLGVDEPELTTGDVLLKRAAAADAIVDTEVENLRLLPANDRLDGDVVELARALGAEQRLRLALESLPTPADVTIIDCPGALSVLTVNALVASDAVVTVAQPTIKELAGLPKMESTIEEVRAAYVPKLRLGAVIPCIVPPATSGAAYTEALQLLRDTYGELVTPPVRRSVRIPEAYAHQRPLPLHAPRDAVTEDYRAVVAHLHAAGLLP
ncbi:ParA family protein [Kineococcus sp. SYSU DK006]|uniref:ParA family protein n=1 Tax=Kineococcus sp. SYSU DK006 TaxID=3383127 RepID=UPI003D7ED4EA